MFKTKAEIERLRTERLVPRNKDGKTYAQNPKVVYSSVSDILEEKKISVNYSPLADNAKTTRPLVRRSLTDEEENIKIANRLTELGL